MQRLLLAPFAPLVLFSLMQAAFLTCLVVLDGHSSPILDAVLSFFWLLALVHTLVEDARQRAVPCFDFGFFLILFFPLSVLWYCWWSRRWRGLLLVLVICGLWVFPWLTVLCAWLLLTALRGG